MKRLHPLAFLLISILLAVLVHSLSFTESPTINDGSNATTTENLRCEWTASGDTTQANVSWFRDGVSFLNTTGASSPSTINSGNTTRGQLWNCTVAITNTTSMITGSDTIKIINADPSVPIIRNETNSDIGNATSLLEDDSRTYNVSSTDPDGDQVSFSTVDLPSGASFNSNTGIMTWTPNASQVGGHTVTFIALDNQTPERGSSAKDVTFTVIEVNDIPEFNPALVNQTATEGQAFTYSITVTDEENDVPINFSISSNIDDLIINRTSNTTADIVFSSGAPGFEDRGNHTINITINDSRNATNIGSFNLEVVPVNQLPNLSFIPNASGTQGGPLLVLFNATDLDMNDTLTFGADSISCSLASEPWNVTKLGQGTQGNATLANATINLTLTNDHAACSQVNITVTDSKQTVWRLVDFNITNVNDAPLLHQNSSSQSNTGGNNITNQTAYTNALYDYQVNATDIDTIVPGGEVLAYSDNTSLFSINSSSGRIRFTPNSSQIGNYSILITVQDDEGLNDTIVMNLEIRNNSAPVLLDTQNQSCAEDVLCTIYISGSDPDGDSMTFSSNNTTLFNLTTFNSTAGIVNATYVQADIGNYSVNITVTDARGATASSIITFTVNNTNDAPVLDAITFPEPIVATHSVTVQVTADDEDIQLFGGDELLNYSNEFITNASLFNISTSFSNITNTSTGTIQFAPSSGETGTHSVNITVSDPGGARDWQVINFTVLNDTDPPNITTIKPYGTPVSNSTVFAFRNTSDFPGSNTTINLTENSTVVFNHTSVDDTTAQENLTYTWFVNGTNIASTQHLTRSLDFFSSANYNITLVVGDDRLENSTFVWFLEIANLNRVPLLQSGLENVSIDSTQTFNSYLYIRDAVRFIDPDDDLNSDGRINGTEVNQLSFNATACSVAGITITNTDVKFTPEEVGTCQVVFTATDPQGASAESNTVIVNVTEVPQGNQQTVTTTTTSSGSGGGGGGSSSSIIPITEEVEKPRPLSIVAPSEVTLYRNKTVTVPVLVENNWNSSLDKVRLGAFTNHSGIDVEFSNSYFESLPLGAKEKVDMTVTGYRLGENFEIVVNATVETPEATDSALILMNSIEQTELGDQVRLKVTFARDLLNSNSECQELGELLSRAERSAGQGNLEEALGMVDTVINGCRYLVGKTQVANRESPKSLELGFLERLNWFYIGSGVLLIALLLAIVAIEVRIRHESVDIEEK